MIRMMLMEMVVMVEKVELVELLVLSVIQYQWSIEVTQLNYEHYFTYYFWLIKYYLHLYTNQY
jgi:hypothetical protein